MTTQIWTAKLGDKFTGESQLEGATGHIDLQARPTFESLQVERGTHGSGLSPSGVPSYGNIFVFGRWSSSSPGLRLLQDGEPIDQVQFFSWIMDPSTKKPAQRIIWTASDCTIRDVREGDLDAEPDAFQVQWMTLKTETKKQDPKTGALGAGTVVIYDRYKGVLSSS
jgi:hypothetical protein